jgi:hypothetical protein
MLERYTQQFHWLQVLTTFLHDVKTQKSVKASTMLPIIQQLGKELGKEVGKDTSSFKLNTDITLESFSHEFGSIMCELCSDVQNTVFELDEVDKLINLAQAQLFT